MVPPACWIGSPDLRRSCGFWRAPLYYADHHGDFIVVIDADPGMGVAWSAEGAQERNVLFKLGQGRAVSKGLLDLACVFVLGSHGHHLLGPYRAGGLSVCLLAGLRP